MALLDFFKVCEFAILFIIFSGFSVLRDFHCGFLVSMEILSGFPVSIRP